MTPWQSGEMALRWTAAGAERQFRKVIGYRDLAKLALAIEHDLARTTVPSPKFHDERDILIFSIPPFCRSSSSVAIRFFEPAHPHPPPTSPARPRNRLHFSREFRGSHLLPDLLSVRRTRQHGSDGTATSFLSR